MTNTLFKVNGYVSSVTTIVNSWLLVPLKTAEREEFKSPNSDLIEAMKARGIKVSEGPNSDILPKISYGITGIYVATTFTYYYHKYLKPHNAKGWILFSLAALSTVAIGGLLCLLLKKYESVSDKITQYVLPLMFALMGIVHVVDMLNNNCRNASGFRILNTINNFFSLADFGPIHEFMKTQPEIYYPVHGFRVLLKNAEGVTLLFEIASTEEEAETQPAFT